MSPSAGRFSQKYVNLDNAATTPAAQVALNAIAEFQAIYGSIHRGSGFKSLISSNIYDRTIEFIRCFIGAAAEDAILLAHNTTSAVNRLAHSLNFTEGDIVLTSASEHTSNDLPWRKYARVVHINMTDDGRLDLNDLEALLRKFDRLEGHRVRLVALTGASSVTGYLPPIKEAARLVHKHNAEVFVDCAQLVAHRPIKIRQDDPDEDWDYIAFSGHKVYSPFGVGVLIGRKHPFEHGTPDIPGGGTVDMVTPDEQVWSSLPNRVSPGTPNVSGLIALAAALNELSQIGFDTIQKHETAIVNHTLKRFETIPEVKLYGQGAFSCSEDRLPIFAFNVNRIPHGLLAATLGHEHDIAVRHGHLCQFEFMRRQLGVTREEQNAVLEAVLEGDKSKMYGMVRASCGLCNTLSDIDRLGDAIETIIQDGPQLEYVQNRSTGHFQPLKSTHDPLNGVPESLHFLF
ncbi:aminotransferase class V-fold PLP-dependent enzyme [Gimesia maris]|uniref:aminotransferase class V-fold PLP-dependent enzyme n=1 Tax=Gimesia maris TaxID=122 RepID=UPI0018D70366|nr:aminotransferase class V-fold PLP-dependent enzyme [Gimesia maris]